MHSDHGAAHRAGTPCAVHPGQLFPSSRDLLPPSRRLPKTCQGERELRTCLGPRRNGDWRDKCWHHAGRPGQAASSDSRTGASVSSQPQGFPPPQLQASPSPEHHWPPCWCPVTACSAECSSQPCLRAQPVETKPGSKPLLQQCPTSRLWLSCGTSSGLSLLLCKMGGKQKHAGHR